MSSDKKRGLGCCVRCDSGEDASEKSADLLNLEGVASESWKPLNGRAEAFVYKSEEDNVVSSYSPLINEDQKLKKN